MKDHVEDSQNSHWLCAIVQSHMLNLYNVQVRGFLMNKRCRKKVEFVWVANCISLITDLC